MLFDTHAHLDDRRFDLDREELLSRLQEQGIGLLMNPGCDLPSSQAASALARRVDWIYAAVGSHPDAADQIGDEVLQEYRNLAQGNSKVKAIGEIGLDYHYEDVPRQQQILCFREQMALARELDLPVIIHEREAHEDALQVLADFPQVTGVFHCYWRFLWTGWSSKPTAPIWRQSPSGAAGMTRAMFTACLRSWQSCGEFRRRKCRKLPWKTENGCTA